MQWYNKATRNISGSFLGIKTTIAQESWNNPRNVFTTVAPPEQCLSGEVECDWNEQTQSWDVDADSQAAYDAEQADTSARETEKSTLQNVTLDQAENWLRARLNATTLDNQTKIELGRIFKNFAAFLI